MTKRRAIIRWDVRALKERLFLPGKIMGIRFDPFDIDVIEIKLEGDDLPEVKEGEPIPHITIEIIEIPGDEMERVMREHALWTIDGVTKHRVVL